MYRSISRYNSPIPSLSLLGRSRLLSPLHSNVNSSLSLRSITPSSVSVTNLPTVTVNSNIDFRILHPNIFHKNIQAVSPSSSSSLSSSSTFASNSNNNTSTTIPAGSLVSVVNDQGVYVGIGFYNKLSKVPLRIIKYYMEKTNNNYSNNNNNNHNNKNKNNSRLLPVDKAQQRQSSGIDVESICRTWLYDTIHESMSLRQNILRLYLPYITDNTDHTDLTDHAYTTAYRIINNDGDSLPGVTVDVYGSVQSQNSSDNRNNNSDKDTVIVVHITTLAMWQRRHIIVEAILNVKQSVDDDDDGNNDNHNDNNNNNNNNNNKDRKRLSILLNFDEHSLVHEGMTADMITSPININELSINASVRRKFDLRLIQPNSDSSSNNNGAVTVNSEYDVDRTSLSANKKLSVVVQEVIDGLTTLRMKMNEQRSVALKFIVDFEKGHKTGFFCDQRDSRALFSRLVANTALNTIILNKDANCNTYVNPKMKGKKKMISAVTSQYSFNPLPRILDICCYTGGFSLAAAVALKHVDSLLSSSSPSPSFSSFSSSSSSSSPFLPLSPCITGVDLDESSLSTASLNASLNSVTGLIKFVHDDAFNYMRRCAENKQEFDIVLLDPPKLIKSKSGKSGKSSSSDHRDTRDSGLTAYRDLNRLGLSLVSVGGIFISFSCSGLLSRSDFESLINEEANRSVPPRRVQIFNRTGPANDHTTMINCPETEYLKGVWMRVW